MQENSIVVVKINDLQILLKTKDTTIHILAFIAVRK